GRSFVVIEFTRKHSQQIGHVRLMFKNHQSDSITVLAGISGIVELVIEREQPSLPDPIPKMPPPAGTPGHVPSAPALFERCSMICHRSYNASAATVGLRRAENQQPRRPKRAIRLMTTATFITPHEFRLSLILSHFVEHDTGVWVGLRYFDNRTPANPPHRDVVGE